MRIFIVGVAGTAMGSLAGLLKELGHDVAGSDIAFFPPMGPALEQWGVRCFEGFDPEVLKGDSHQGKPPEAIVVGNVCRRDNPQAVAALELGIERMHLADALRRFVLPHTSSLVVTGTHGKTTTSSLCAHLLTQVGLEPGYLIGGIPQSLGKSFRPVKKRLLHKSGVVATGRATPFVLEGDEYDTAYWEKTAKFLHYDAEVAVLTSIEHDHVDIYPRAEDYENAFLRLMEQLPAQGLLIAYAGDQKVVELSQRARCEVAYYGLSDEPHAASPHWLGALAQSDASGTSFDLYAGGVLAGRFVSPLSGRHNVKNCIAALAACAQGYGAPLAALMEPLAEFQGVKRRQEIVGTPRDITVYDDFAHHPTAVAETLAGLRLRHGQGKLIAIFEPRSATACRKMHQHAYETAFAAATHVILAPVGRSELSAEERLNVPLLAQRLQETTGTPERAWALSDVESIIKKACELAAPGDAIAILSNGAFGGIHGKLVQALGQGNC